MNVIITGSTGMVGEGVLLECLKNPKVEKILVINRRPLGITHPKLKEVIHKDFFDLTPIENHLKGYNACFFCLGVSSIGMSQHEYKRKTYDLTLHCAQLMHKNNPDMTFCYVTGKHTDSTENKGMAWARVKGATENALLRLFKKSYMFRPAMMRATPGQKNLPKIYHYFGWIYPIGRALSPSNFCTLEEVGVAMINAATKGGPKQILEVKDIVELSRS